MAFPSTKLGIMVELGLGVDLTSDPTTWSWTDISSYVRFADGITITRGRPNAFTSAPPSQAKLTLLNDGRFVIRNPTGPYYGTISRNTPLRILVRPDVNTSADTFTRTVSNGWGTADRGGAWTVNGTASEYSTTGSVGRITFASANVRRYATLAASLTTFDTTVRVRTSATATGGYLSAAVLFRFADTSNFDRAEVLFNTDQSITCRIGTRVAGTDAFPASATVTGLTHVANTFYRLRVQSTNTAGTAVRAKVWLDGTAEPSTWSTTVATTANTAAGAMGVTGIRQVGNTNTSPSIDFDDWSFTDGWQRRHTGFVDQWPTRWNDAGLRQATAPVTASGTTRRLTQGKVLSSALRSAILNAGTPKGYWPAEDPSGATQIASAVPGGTPMVFSSGLTLASGQIIGSESVVVIPSSGNMLGTVVPYTGTDWSVHWMINIPTASGAEGALLRWYTDGTYPIWQLVLTPSGGTDTVSLRAYDSTLAEHLADPGVSLTNEPYGQQWWIEVKAAASGGSLNYTYTIYPRSSASITGSGTKGSTTPGHVTGLGFGAGQGSSFATASIGHFTVWGDSTTSLGANAGNGWDQEASTTRYLRLGSQEHVSLTVTATPTISYAAMGPPSAGTLLTQLREIETADQGLMYDDTDGSVALLPRESRYNQAVTLTLDASASQVGWPLEPADDDQQLHNDITSAKPTGSSFRVQDTFSALATASVGTYSTQATVNVADDLALQQDASWRLNLGTVNELRFPQVSINLTRTPTLITTWLAANIGQRIRITHPPTVLNSGTLDLILEGYTERFDTELWVAALNTSPAKPWNVFVTETGTGNQSRLDSGSSTLAAAVNSAATSLSVATSNAADLWTTTGGDFPFDIGIGGEQITVTAVSGSTSPQTFTVTRAVNGISKSQAAGQTVSLWQPSVLAL